MPRFRSRGPVARQIDHPSVAEAMNVPGASLEIAGRERIPARNFTFYALSRNVKVGAAAANGVSRRWRNREVRQAGA